MSDSPIQPGKTGKTGKSGKPDKTGKPSPLPEPSRGSHGSDSALGSSGSPGSPAFHDSHDSHGSYGATRYTLFTALFFVLCLIPSVGMLFAGESTPVGNERLAPRPLLLTEEGKLNPHILSECSAYFNDHMAGRHQMITAHSVLTASLFRVLTNEDVILGDDGWLYYAETLPDYLGMSRMSERECYAAARTLYLVQQYVAQQGARFVFTIAPNKNSLYPEHMPARYPPSALPRNAERLSACLADLAVPYVDLFAALRAASDIPYDAPLANALYYATDSHWNTRGAALAGDRLYEALTRPEQEAGSLPRDRFFPGSYTMQGSHRGDLYQMAYPAGTQTEADAVFDRGVTFQYEGNFRSPEDIRIQTTNAGKAGSLVMFRDSFGNALHPFLAERFGKAFFSRATPYDLTTVAREQSDRVVIELVERNLPTLCTRPPVFPAPVCPGVFLDTGKDVPVRPGDTASASCQDSDRLAGYCQITGNVVCDGLDDETSLLVQIGGTLYEATPAGEGEQPFTLYVPGAAADIRQTDSIVIVTANGQETICPLLWE